MCQDRVCNLEARLSRNREKDFILTEGGRAPGVHLGYTLSLRQAFPTSSVKIESIFALLDRFAPKS
jgi:hypothetical protein